MVIWWNLDASFLTFVPRCMGAHYELLRVTRHATLQHVRFVSLAKAVTPLQHQLQLEYTLIWCFLSCYPCLEQKTVALIC